MMSSETKPRNVNAMCYNLTETEELPSGGFMVRRREDKVAARALTKEEISKVYEALTGHHALRNKALFVLMVRTGFRVSEAISLYVQDVYQHGQIVDIVTVTKQHMKGKNKGRTVRLHREAKEILAQYITESKLEFGRLFDISRNQAWKIFDAAFQSAKIASPHGTHACRKTFATTMYKRLNSDIFLTAQLMGHKSIQSTANYLAVDQEKLTAALLGEE